MTLASPSTSSVGLLAAGHQRAHRRRQHLADAAEEVAGQHDRRGRLNSMVVKPVLAPLPITSWTSGGTIVVERQTHLARIDPVRLRSETRRCR